MAASNTLHEQTLCELTELLATGKASSVELTAACFAREQATREVNAFVHLAEEAALAAAKAADDRRARGERLGPLDGIPLGLKDILATTDQPTTCASKLLAGYTAPYDATVVTRLRSAGAVLIGKLNMDEFAMGSSNEFSAYGPVRNPWDRARVPGGSSGGSAAAVAAGSAVAALGTDTGGSIRQPAAMCGVVGLKPTYGAVSRYGSVAYASSLDQIGPMAKTVADCATLFSAIAGACPHDATSRAHAWPSAKAMLEGGVKGLRVGVPKGMLEAGVEPEVVGAVERAIDELVRLGAERKEISLPHTRLGIATYYVLATAEAASNLSRFDGVRFGARRASKQSLEAMYTQTRSEGFGSEVKRRIMLGTWVLSAEHRTTYYAQAQKSRALVHQDFVNAFAEVDVLATPCAPTTAFRLGEKNSDPMSMYMADVFTVNANLAGLCGLSLPCGFDSSQLPIGLQLLGPSFADATLLRAAYAYEQSQPWHKERAMP